METILVVEDELHVLELVCRFLKNYGYTVIPATSGAEALSICETRKEPIHLLVTDVVMPTMSGRKLADRLLLLHPETNVLYMSGYTDEAIVHHGVLDSGTLFLHKPFTAEVLARKVREVLDRVQETQPS